LRRNELAHILAENRLHLKGLEAFLITIANTRGNAFFPPAARAERPIELIGKRVAIGADVLVRELQGELVLLNLKSETYFGLDEVGTRMWSVLTSTPSIRAAVDPPRSRVRR
jgi:hypothetical protein